MRVAIFSNHEYDQNSFEEANGSFKHELVFLSATLDSATASLASGFPAVCAFVNDRLDVVDRRARGGASLRSGGRGEHGDDERRDADQHGKQFSGGHIEGLLGGRAASSFRH